MKTIIIDGIIVFAVALLAPQIVQAQGTTYMSNLDQPSAGSQAVGRDSWLGMAFCTGNNAGGYVLNSVQLGMTDASGNPSSFRAMIYGLASPGTGSIPGGRLGTLSGDSDPATSGIFTYAAAPNFTLSPNTWYSIVLTAGTSVANGSYGLSLASTYSSSSSDGWGKDNVLWHSSNGLSWSGNGSIYPQYAIDATAVPEPGVLGLFALSGLSWAWRRVFRR